MRSIYLIVIATVVTTIFLPISSYRILGIVPIASYSHQVVFHNLWRELSLRGHKVTVITTNPIKDAKLTNLTEIDVSSSYELIPEGSMNDLHYLNRFETYNYFMHLGFHMCDHQLGSPQVKKLIEDESQHFDLLLAELHYQLMFAFAERFKCPSIAISSLDANSRIYNAIGNPYHPVLNPEMFSESENDLPFQERLISTMYTFYMKYVVNYFHVGIQNDIVEKHFGKNYPSVDEMERNISMIFINTENIFHRVRPLLPNVIQIGGGTHLKPSKLLPPALQQQLDAATAGFVYFSLGSNVKSEHLPLKVRQMLMETFADLPYLVLWKFEKDLPGKPKNVVISKWFPQTDVLRHPNIKVFITQGGLQSCEEAIHSHVPLVIIPQMGDQQRNAENYAQKNIGLATSFKDLNKKLFKEIILEVSENPKYREQVKKYADLVIDQPMTGLEKAIWWTEYVLRHKGARHFRSPAMDLPFYQYLLLDVIFVFVITLALLVTLFLCILRFIVKVAKKFKLKSKSKKE